MATKDTNKGILALVVIVVLGIITYSLLTLPDRRTTGQRVGDAIDALPQGVDKAAEQLQDRTPGERLGDAVENVGEEIKENTNR